MNPIYQASMMEKSLAVSDSHGPKTQLVLQVKSSICTSLSWVFRSSNNLADCMDSQHSEGTLPLRWRDDVFTLTILIRTCQSGGCRGASRKAIAVNLFLHGGKRTRN